MDIRGYFRKVRELEATIDDRFVVVVSLPTIDGGVAGIFTEVPRFVGCQLVTEGRARLAGAEEAESFRSSVKAAFEAEQTYEDERRGAGRSGLRETKLTGSRVSKN